MADTLADTLNKAGLISEQERDQVLADNAHCFAEREALWRKAARKGNRTEHLSLVQDGTSITEFKDAARKLLCECPERIEDVIKASHHFKKREGGGKLVWLCYQVRDLLPQVPPEKRERFLKRAFRSAGGTVTISD